MSQASALPTAQPIELRVRLPEGGLTTRQLVVGSLVTLGRDPACEIVVDTPEVSRRHLRIEHVGSGLQLSDTSANGTFVGSHRLQRTSFMLPHQQPVALGSTVLHVSWDFAVVACPEPAPTPTPQEVDSEVRVADRGAASPELALSGDLRRDNAALRKKIHGLLLDHLDLSSLDGGKLNDETLRPKVNDALERIVADLEGSLPPALDRKALIRELSDEALGLGPLEQLLADDSVSEIMVVDPQTIFVERSGRVEKTELQFTDDNAVRAVIERIVTPLGRRIDESTPIVDARLKDGSRVNAVIRPLAINGACITIRKFAKEALGMDDLVGFGALTPRMAKFLQRSVISRKNVVVSGGTGSGKTTLLNVLSTSIPTHERVVTIEDAAELRLQQPHVVSLETRPPNMEGRGAYTIRDLVKNALRMRPDRIVVGECRGGEALDMLQAMNTGHEGSMTTTHANSPIEALARLETLALMSGLDLPARAIREQIGSSVHLILQQTRFADGSRRVTSITEVGEVEDGKVELREIFQFLRTGTAPDGKIQGEFRATGYLPSFLDEFIAQGLVKEGDYL